MEDSRPLFIQIASQIEASILDGSLTEEERAPSSNELAAFHRINPATAAKGLSLLAERGILVKRRGLGMFVAQGAQEMLRQQRRERFTQDFLEPLLAEAHAIGLSATAVVQLIQSSHDPHRR